jgi:hypothetical protein
LFSVDSDEEEEDEDWFIDCPIFIAADLVFSIAVLTFSVSEGCKSVSFISLSSLKAFSMDSATSVGILLLNYSS